MGAKTEFSVYPRYKLTKEDDIDGRADCLANDDVATCPLMNKDSNPTLLKVPPSPHLAAPF